MILEYATPDKKPVQKKEVHVHTYERVTKKPNLYRCVHPDCKHYTDKIFLDGKRARCYKCPNTFILTKDQLKNKRPVCLNCSKSQKKTRVEDIKSKLEDLFKDAR